MNALAFLIFLIIRTDLILSQSMDSQLSIGEEVDDSDSPSSSFYENLNKRSLIRNFFIPLKLKNYNINNMRMADPKSDSVTSSISSSITSTADLGQLLSSSKPCPLTSDGRALQIENFRIAPESLDQLASLAKKFGVNPNTHMNTVKNILEVADSEDIMPLYPNQPVRSVGLYSSS